MGMRREVWSGGVLVDFEDTRTVSEMVALKLDELRQKCSEMINREVAPHDQMNAALGILDEEDLADVRAAVVTRRTQYQRLKAAVEAIAAAAVDDDDKGACDAIGKVTWHE